MLIFLFRDIHFFCLFFFKKMVNVEEKYMKKYSLSDGKMKSPWEVIYNLEEKVDEIEIMIRKESG